MKTKKLNKKLTLSKETVSSLNHDHMNNVNAGKDFDEDYKTRTYGNSCLFCGITANFTNCDLQTNCYNISKCATVCGGPYC